MRTPITLPDLGFPHVVLSAWLAQPGDEVHERDALVEVLAHGALVDVASPVSGTLVQRDALPRDRLAAGQVLGWVEGTPP